MNTASNLYLELTEQELTAIVRKHFSPAVITEA